MIAYFSYPAELHLKRGGDESRSRSDISSMSSSEGKMMGASSAVLRIGEGAQRGDWRKSGGWRCVRGWRSMVGKLE